MKMVEPMAAESTPPAVQSLARLALSFHSGIQHLDRQDHKNSQNNYQNPGSDFKDKSKSDGGGGRKMNFKIGL